jgi:protein required for attachment to host cells
MPPETPRLSNHATGGKSVKGTDSIGNRGPKVTPTRKRKLSCTDSDEELILDSASDSESLCSKSRHRDFVGVSVRPKLQEKQDSTITSSDDSENSSSEEDDTENTPDSSEGEKDELSEEEDEDDEDEAYDSDELAEIPDFVNVEYQMEHQIIVAEARSESLQWSESFQRLEEYFLLAMEKTSNIKSEFLLKKKREMRKTNDCNENDNHQGIVAVFRGDLQEIFLDVLCER